MVDLFAPYEKPPRRKMSISSLHCSHQVPVNQAPCDHNLTAILFDQIREAIRVQYEERNRISWEFYAFNSWFRAACSGQHVAQAIFRLVLD